MRPDIVEGRGRLPCVRVSSSRASGAMYLLGGQITSWAPAGHGEVLFVSNEARWEPGRAIRGGIPVCFPWFGPKANDAQAPAHGFVRVHPWQLEGVSNDDDAATVTMAIESSEETRRLWPGEFRLVQRARFGSTLTVDLTVTNTGNTPFQFQEALHSYYRVGHIGKVSVRGLDRVSYLDAVDAFTEKTQQGDVTFNAETDRVYLNTPSTIDIHDRALGRRVRVGTGHARNAVVWNPWIGKAQALTDLGDDEWQRFVCVETANVRAAAVTLAPGAAHTMHMRVSVDSEP